MKTYIIKKGTSIQIKRHYWDGWHEAFHEVINTVVDENIIIRSRDELNNERLFKMLRKKYNLKKTANNSFIYSYKIEEIK